MDLMTLLNAARADNDGTVYDLPENWLQGRTAYGGLTAAIAMAEAQRRFTDLPPLRTLQVAFVAPASGQVRAEARMLRQGRSTSFVETNLHGEKGLVTHASMVFGVPRDSAVRWKDLPMPSVPGLAEAGELYNPPPSMRFLSQFELIPQCPFKVPFGGADVAEVTWWARLRDPSARNALTGLIALGDIAPPAAAMLLKEAVPVSSVNWHFDVLSDDLTTEDGWYLVQSRSQSAGHGWSAQTMGIWSSDGRPVAAGRQSVLVFG